MALNTQDNSHVILMGILLNYLELKLNYCCDCTLPTASVLNISTKQIQSLKLSVINNRE